MATDQLVTATDVLQALSEVRRVGAEESLRDLERREPDLTEFLLERLSDLHQQILMLSPHPRKERRLVHRIKSLVLVLLTALRRAQLREWDEGANPAGK